MDTDSRTSSTESVNSNQANSPANSLEQLIQDVAARANIGDSTSEHVVDMVLTAVKRNLPDKMSSRLVAVMSGEDSFGGNSDSQSRHGSSNSSSGLNSERISETIGDVGDNITRVGGQVFEDATRIGGKAFEEAGRVGSRVMGDAGTVADKFSRWAKDAIEKQKDKR